MEQSTSQSSAVSAAGERPFAEVEAALEKSGRVEDLLKLYESRTRDVPPQEAGALLCRAADVARDRLKSFTRAEEYLRRALLFVPASPEPLKGLKRLFEQKQDLAALAETAGAAGRAVLGHRGGRGAQPGRGHLRGQALPAGPGDPLPPARQPGRAGGARTPPAPAGAVPLRVPLRRGLRCPGARAPSAGERGAGRGVPGARRASEGRSHRAPAGQAHPGRRRCPGAGGCAAAAAAVRARALPRDLARAGPHPGRPGP